MSNSLDLNQVAAKLGLFVDEDHSKLNSYVILVT